jgi:hypothetical protein
MEAIGKYVIVLPKKDILSKSEKGLLMDNKTREDIRYREAEIISIGMPILGLEPGTKILYDMVAGHMLEGVDKDYRLIKIDDIVVKL